MTTNIVMIGISTGGPVVLRQLLAMLPVLDAAVIIVLHIPPGMDGKIAGNLDVLAAMPVRLAGHGEPIRPGHVYLAPGGFHLSLEGNSRIVLDDGPRVNFVQPSADVAMKSLLKPIKRQVKIVGIVMTGMGKDGAAGIRHIKEIGGTTMAQNKASCAIYGMPKAAVDTGAVDFEATPLAIGERLVELFG